MSTTFLLLLNYSVGTAWAAVLPRASLVEGTRFSRLAPLIHFINPGPFGLKEVRRTRSISSRNIILISYFACA